MKILSEELVKPVVKKHPFNIRTLSSVLMDDLQPVKKLVGDLIYPEEQTILFGGTNIGKSILAMQIARAICSGESLNLGGGIYLENECDPINVIYYDFELSQRQIQNRYNSKIDCINLYWANITRGEILETEPKKVFEQLKSGAEDVEAKCMIIDNISAISGDLEKGENAKAFMGELWKLARDENYTIIVISHITKMGKSFEPIKIEHLKGSASIGQLADNVIGMGKVNCDNDNEVYIKQIKVRNTAKKYGAANVIQTQTKMIDDTLVHDAIGIVNEQELLSENTGLNGRNNNRQLFVFASLYYGNNEASRILNKAGVPGSSKSNVSTAVKAFKDADSKLYKRYEELSADHLKTKLEFESPLDDCLPLRDGHQMNEDNQMPF